MPANTPAAVAPDRQAIPALLTKALIREHFVPLGERTLDRWISSGTFPRPDISNGGKLRYWKRETVEAWIDAQAQGGGRE
jgi:predicted DNA-binding transcriptional regulator AlpA